MALLGVQAGGLPALMNLLRDGSEQCRLYACMSLWSFIATPEQCAQYGGMVHQTEKFKPIIANTPGAVDALASLLVSGSADSGAKIHAAGASRP